jgi:hypothetical protein
MFQRVIWAELKEWADDFRELLGQSHNDSALEVKFMDFYYCVCIARYVSH